MIVLDTHALVWWASGSTKVSARARTAIRQALRHGPLLASAISVLELATAVRRGRLRLGMPFTGWLQDLEALPELRFVPVSSAIAQAAGSFDEALRGDPADRIIVATARAGNARLVTADEKIRDSALVKTIW